MNLKSLSLIPFAYKLLCLSLLITISILITTQLAFAENSSIKRGAQLYDKWFKISGDKPEGNHPLYPAIGKKSGDTTWRCKECHGWDYIGNKGRYQKGSHFTGITGVAEASGKSAQEIYNVISGTEHAFADKISDADLKALAAFIKSGQIDINKAIDSNGRAIGNLANGSKQYNENCSDCHGDDGNEIDFKEEKDGIQGVGWLANDNPQETLHKILWGHPGSDMPSLVVDAKQTDQDAIDVLTYSQTLQ